MHVTLTTRPSRPERPNEDLVTATDDLVVVLDGTTVPGGRGADDSLPAGWGL